MRLNTIKPGAGSKTPAKRLGRGMGSGKGKTCGRGHKGQRARAGGFHKVGFEGGQAPLQRRLPKFGFTSLSQKNASSVSLRLHELVRINLPLISLATLKENGVISSSVKRVKVIASGKLDQAVHLAADILITANARAAILAAGGKVDA